MRSLMAGFIAAGIFITLSAQAGKKAYSMDDLKALEKSESWNELLQHATDVAPTQRNPEWQTLVEKAATAEISGDAATAHWTTPQLIKSFPFLKKSKAFMELGSAKSLEAMEPCFERWDIDHCIKELNALLEQNPGDTQLALKAGQLVARKSNAQNAAPLFRRAVTDKDKKACSDEALRRSTLAALGVPNGKVVDAAKELAGKFCWNEMKAEIDEAFNADPDGYFGANACPMLKAKGMLSGLRAKKCEKHAKN